jgi:hypothetical protein
LREWALVFSAIQNDGDPLDAVMGLLHLDSEPYAIPILAQLGLPTATHFDESAWRRLAGANKSEVWWVADFLVGSFPTGLMANSLAVERTRSGSRLVAQTKFLGLADALRWMFWEDVFLERPIQFCIECQKLIINTSKHTRKYCLDGCGHRRTARESARRKREGERKHGIKKAR